MALTRKIRRVGNSAAIAIPNEIFDFLNFDPETIKYKLSQDETGKVYIYILNKDVMVLDEKNLQKQRNSYLILIPKSLCNMWNIGFEENQKKEVRLEYLDCPNKWLIQPN